MPQSLDILVIDDDKFSQIYIEKALRDKHSTITALNGEEGLKKAHELNPDIILLDVEMPGLNGYEVCDKIKQDEDIRQIPVIFLSSKSSTRERMQGYEVGADDYLAKPFEPEDLLAKIKVLNRYRRQQHQLEQQVQTATKTAFTAMTGSNDLAQAMTFIEACYASSGYEDLANKLFSILSTFSLNTVLLIKTIGRDVFYSMAGNATPLESELMQKLHQDKRFIDFGSRTQINYPNCALLVKNMPLNNMERYGTLKDLLPVMLGATDTRVVSFRSEQAAKEQNEQMVNSFNLIRTILTGLGERLTSNQQAGSQILQDMINTLTSRVPTLGLEEDQEDFLLSTIDKAIIETMELMRDSAQNEEIFTSVLSKLNLVMEKQKTILLSQSNAYQDSVSGQDNQVGMEVELF